MRTNNYINGTTKYDVGNEPLHCNAMLIHSSHPGFHFKDFVM
jgi:hypothetical protein